MPVFPSDTPDGTNEGIGCKEIRFRIQAWLENAHFFRSFLHSQVHKRKRWITMIHRPVSRNGKTQAGSPRN